MRLEGKTAVITGAACGIGRAIALAFLREGARTALVDIDEIALGAAERRLRETERDVLAIPADATKAGEVARVIDTTLSAWGRINILVNNVGGNIGDGSLDGPEEDWDATYELCFKSHFLASRAVAPIMRAQKSGR